MQTQLDTILPSVLLAERKRNSLTRETVAKYVNKSEQLIGKWERGEQSPKIYPDGVKLAQLFNCSLDYLAGLKENRL